MTRDRRYLAAAIGLAATVVLWLAATIGVRGGQPAAPAQGCAAPDPGFCIYLPVASKQRDETLPNTGIVIISFADTFKSAYTKALPVLRARGVHAVAWINPANVGTTRKMTDADVTELNAAGWGIGSHGWTHAHPTTLGDAELREHLERSHQWLLDHGFTRGAQHYNPPSADCDARVLEVALNYYTTVKDEVGAACFWYPTGYTYYQSYGHDEINWDETLKPLIDGLRTNDDVLMIGFHDIVDVNPAGLQATVERLTQVIDYAQGKRLNIMTPSEFLDYDRGRAPSGR